MTLKEIHTEEVPIKIGGKKVTAQRTNFKFNNHEEAMKLYTVLAELNIYATLRTGLEKHEVTVYLDKN